MSMTRAICSKKWCEVKVPEKTKRMKDEGSFAGPRFRSVLTCPRFPYSAGEIVL